MALTFSGKYSFGSTNTTGEQVFLTLMPFGQERQDKMDMPVINAKSVGSVEQCITYDTGTGTIIQLGSLQYLSLLPTANDWIGLNPDRAHALVFQVSTAGGVETWSAQRIDGTFAKVNYTVDNVSPILTLNSGPGSLDTFAAGQITPPLSQILSNKDGHGLNFQNVDLSDLDLSGVNFAGADFTAATLMGTSFRNCTLTGAIFNGAALGGTIFDGAILDQAVFTGWQTMLATVVWGTPKSAKGIDLSGCNGRGIQLGASNAKIDCTGANLSGGDFTGANLSYLLLRSAKLAGANFGGACNLSAAVLDGSDCTRMLGAGGNFANCSLQDVAGHGAVLMSANLNSAMLSRSQFGSKKLLFTLGSQYSRELDQDKYVQPDLQGQFGAYGITLQPTAAVEVITKGNNWMITDQAAGSFQILNNSASLSVYRAGESVPPAVFTSALMFETQAPGASFASADLTGVQWYGGSASASYADFSSANLAGSLMIGTDFTQAQLYGSDFGSAVLIQAKMRGAVPGPSPDGRPVSFSLAMLQGTDFTGTTFLGGLLCGARVSLAQGVPLFVMPSSYATDLNAQGLPRVASYFSSKSYPLGASATIGKVQAWDIDNSMDTKPNATTHFTVQNQNCQLSVYDGDTHAFLFNLDVNMLPFLSQLHPEQPLIQQFNRNSYDLNSEANIVLQPYWQITNSQDFDNDAIRLSIHKDLLPKRWFARLWSGRGMAAGISGVHRASSVWSLGECAAGVEQNHNMSERLSALVF